jgi:hypothetical protein
MENVCGGVKKYCCTSKVNITTYVSEECPGVIGIFNIHLLTFEVIQ